MSAAKGARMRATLLIGIRGFRLSLYGAGLYLVAFISCAVAAILASIYLGTIKENGLLIISNPLVLPLNTALTISAVYLAFAASVSISRERDSGTLEVLFYGPVDAASYIGAKYLEQILCYLVVLFFYGLVFAILGAITGFGFSTEMGLDMVLALPLISSITAFGILLSSVTSKIRTSVLALIGLLAVFIGLEWSESLLAGFDQTSLPPVLFYARSFLSAAARAAGWVSPFAYLNRGLQAVAVGSAAGYVGSFFSAMGYSVLLLLISTFILSRKGVKA